MRLFKTCALALLVGISGCASVRVQTEADPSMALAMARSYRWERPPMATGECSAQSQAVDKAVRDVVDQRLKRMGFVRVERGADVVLDYHIGQHQGANVSGPLGSDDCFREWRGMKGRAVGPSAAEELPPFYRDYELSLEMTSEQQQLRWRGVGLKLYSQQLDTEGEAEFAQDAAEHLMKAFKEAQK